MIHERNTDSVNTNQNPAWGTIIGFAAMGTDTEIRVVILAVSLFFITHRANSSIRLLHAYTYSLLRHSINFSH